MDKTITLSYLADLIIVCGFAGIIGTVGGTAIGHLVLFIGGRSVMHGGSATRRRNLKQLSKHHDLAAGLQTLPLF